MKIPNKKYIQLHEVSSYRGGAYVGFFNNLNLKFKEDIFKYIYPFYLAKQSIKKIESHNVSSLIADTIR